MTAVAPVELWKGDSLYREQEAKKLRAFLLKRLEEKKEQEEKTSYVLNVDGDWGSGKTYFLKNFYGQLVQDHYLAVYIDAWADDFAEDPFIPVIQAIQKEISPHFKGDKKAMAVLNAISKSGAKLTWIAAKHLAIHGATQILGEGTKEAIEDMVDEVESGLNAGYEELIAKNGKSLLNEFEANKSIVEDFQKRLAQALKFLEESKRDNTKLPLFIIIDELDRCRPTYAIALLERIKHLFNIENVVFILGTNTEQICHSIKAVYGNEFSSQRYLLRFFNRTYRLNAPDMESFVGVLFHEYKGNSALSSPKSLSNADFFAGAMRAFKLELRDAMQCFDILKTIVTNWSEKVQIELAYMLPFIVFFQQNDLKSFDKLINSPSFDAIESWGIFFEVRRETEGYVMEAIDFVNIYRAFHEFSTKTLGKINEYHELNEPKRWIRSRFIEEMAKIHRNQNLNNVFSILKTYPERVKYAGRYTVIVSEESV